MGDGTSPLYSRARAVNRSAWQCGDWPWGREGREGLSSWKCGVQHLVDSFQAPTSLLPLDLCSPPSGTQAPQHTVLKPRCSTCLFSPHRRVPPPPAIFATPFPSQCTQLTSELSPFCQSFWSRKFEFPSVPPLSSSVLAAGRSTSHLSVLLCFTFRKSGRACHYHPSATWWRTVSATPPTPPSPCSLWEQKHHRHTLLAPLATVTDFLWLSIWLHPPSRPCLMTLSLPHWPSSEPGEFLSNLEPFLSA